MSNATRRYADVQRVSQLDALRLDDELLTLFLGSIRGCLRFFPQSTLEACLPELQVLLRLFFHANTVMVQRASPGNAFQNLCYIPLTPMQRAAHMALDVLLPYAFSSLRRELSISEWSRRDSRRRLIWRTVNYIESGARLATVLNLALFFRYGTFRSLADRLVGARLAYYKRHIARAPAFEFVNAQLVWEGVAELALMVSPLLSRVGGLGQSRVGRRVLAGLGVAQHSTIVGGDGLGVDKCGVCGGGEITMKHRAKPCSHVFCYTCVATELERDPGMRCGVCGAGVHDIERVKFTSALRS